MEKLTGNAYAYYLGGGKTNVGLHAELSLRKQVNGCRNIYEDDWLVQSEVYLFPVEETYATVTST